MYPTMTKRISVSGEVIRVDLEGGYLALRLANGDLYKLDGIKAGTCSAGDHVRITGSISKGILGIGFGAPTLQVEETEILSS